MKFKYSGTLALDSKGRMVKRPMLKLELTLKDGRKIYPLGLIDSGADQTMVNIAYAKELGVDLNKAAPRQMNGIANNSVSTLLATFPLKSPELGEEVVVPACYVDSRNVDILIGQEGFFDTYRIKFEKDHDSFEITKKK